MENHDNNPNKRQGKDNGFEAQMKVVFKAFYEQPKTMLMVSNETGILRANICRYVAKWRENNRVEPVKTDYCKITKHPADYLTTNENLFPKSNQLKMF
tara:strand:- start:239 stop:532 length:294 start_codon:yes stop_codon:yes gene_type:complete